MSEKNYREIVIVRIGEIVLKKLNRHKFEQQLIRNLRAKFKNLSQIKIHPSQSRIRIEPENEQDIPQIIEACKKVFGVVSCSRARSFHCDDFANLKDQVLDYANSLWQDGKKHTFKFETRRINKQFPLSTYDINCKLGELLLDTYGDLAEVDVHDPDYIIQLELRDISFLYHEIVPAFKGLPVGTGGKGMLLLSGGIDSPVAGFMMASRGMELEAIYFHTFPYTSDRAKQKVIDLAAIIADYCHSIKLHIVDFTDIQLEINEHCPKDMLTIVMRRVMMRIAEQVAKRTDCHCLITGESLGQVASQTLQALNTTNCVVDLPVFRPLIGMDKDDTVALARKIGTFETSILPYEDCCTVFVAKHPKTKPQLTDAESAEQGLDIEALVQAGINRITTVEV